MNDTIKDIKNYECYYEIHNTGEVFSKISNRFLTKNLRNGYYYVTLRDNTKHKIHKLVANHFIENTDDHKCVDHIDRNKLNNNVNNLRFCSYTENNRNRTIHKNNMSGYVGIYVDKRTKKYKAFIYNNYKQLFLGYHKNVRDALNARINAECSIFKQFRNPINSTILSILTLR